MSRLKSLPRTLAATLAIAALAAPVAAARPIQQPAGEQTALSERTQDLRHLNAGGDIRTSSLAGTTEAQLGDAGPVYWSYDHPAPVPTAQVAVDADDGAPWMPIGIAVAGVCLLIAVATALSGRIRPRSRSARAAA
jgi:hypothetical protein